MISSELLDFFDVTIENWNAKQKIIANDLLIDPTYQIFKLYDNRNPKLLLRNLKNGTVIDFEKFVKSKCNC